MRGGKVIVAKIGDLPRHRKTIMSIIAGHPGIRARAVSTELERSYGIRVDYNAIKKYCDREELWDTRPEAIENSFVTAATEASVRASAAAADTITTNLDE